MSALSALAELEANLEAISAEAPEVLDYRESELPALVAVIRAGLEAAEPTLCDTHEAGACPEGCPDAYAFGETPDGYDPTTGEYTSMLDPADRTETYAQRCRREDEEDRLALLARAREAWPNVMELAEVSIELDACGDLETLLSEPTGAIWLRRTDRQPNAGWPVIEVRGPRAEVREYIRLHWGDQMIEDLEDGGEL